jgi:uncharacterized delta-60 repeat protein
MSTSFEVIRYNADGTLDRTFGYRGMVTTRFSAKDDSASDLAVDAEGRIVVAGVAGQGRGGRGDSWFALARYESDGTLDRTFGKTKADFSHNTDGAIAVVLQADGRIVLAGTADYLGPHDAFALAGFLS